MPHIIIKKPTPNKQHVDAEKLFCAFVESCPDSSLFSSKYWSNDIGDRLLSIAKIIIISVEGLYF